MANEEPIAPDVHPVAPSVTPPQVRRESFKSFLPILIVLIGFLLGVGLLLTAIVLDFHQG